MVKVAVLVTGGSHELVTVQETVTLPPQNEGAAGVNGSLVRTPLHPPVKEAVFNQVLKSASTAACVIHVVPV